MKVNLSKSIILGIFTVMLFSGVLLNRYTMTDAAPYLTLILGYVIGNGVQAFRGENPAPLVKKTNVTGRRSDDGT